MQRSLRFVGLLSLATTACDVPVACPTVPAIAVEVTVRDSVSGAAAADRATGTLFRGGETLPMEVGSSDSAGHAVALRGGGQPGRYDVQIAKPGYRTWERQGVRVDDSNCGAVTERLEARLQPGES